MTKTLTIKIEDEDYNAIIEDIIYSLYGNDTIEEQIDSAIDELFDNNYHGEIDTSIIKRDVALRIIDDLTKKCLLKNSL